MKFKKTIIYSVLLIASCLNTPIHATASEYAELDHVTDQTTLHERCHIRLRKNQSQVSHLYKQPIQCHLIEQNKPYTIEITNDSSFPLNYKLTTPLGIVYISGTVNPKDKKNIEDVRMNRHTDVLIKLSHDTECWIDPESDGWTLITAITAGLTLPCCLHHAYKTAGFSGKITLYQSN